MNLIKNHFLLSLGKCFLLFLGAFLFGGSANAQNNTLEQQLFRQSEGLYRIAEPGEIADTVNVWGDVSRTGRYVVPVNLTLPQLMSYAGGPLGLNKADVLNLSKVRIRVNISRYLYQENKSSIANFEFAYKDPLPPELFKFRLKNEDVVSIEVKRKPNFTDYLRTISPIVGILTSTIVLIRVLN